MPQTIPMNIIAHIHTDFPTKFGIPRQSGLIDTLRAAIVFEPEYRNPDALRGLDAFSHIWLIWQFSGNTNHGWSPTVRPPRLGGNTRMGVFATRSPFRPNAIGLSSVRLDHVELNRKYGPVIYVLGADLMDGTPVLDIKPYLAYTDSHPDAASGFSVSFGQPLLKVDFPTALLERIPENQRNNLIAVLEQDPRPAYHDTIDRIYGMLFAGFNIRFTVSDNCLSVQEVESCIM